MILVSSPGIAWYDQEKISLNLQQSYEFVFHVFGKFYYDLDEFFYLTFIS